MSEHATIAPAADPATVLGPRLSRNTADELARQVGDAVAKGAAASIGGRRIPVRGTCSGPPVRTDVTPTMRAYTRSNKNQIRSPR